MVPADDSAKPRIAVIIPCFEDGAYVTEAVRSVQETEPVEAVVVDDGSTDAATHGALERLEARGTRVVRLGENRGVSAARSAGLRATTARYVYPLDADDLAPPGILAKMADRLDADRGAAVCYGDFVEFGVQLRLRSVPRWIDPYRLTYTNEYPAAAMFRRSILEKVGGWRRVSPELDARSDWSLWMTLAERGARGVHMGPRVVTRVRRLHSDRLDAEGRRRRPHIYACLRDLHQTLFEGITVNRRASDLNPVAKLFYPIVYGKGRRRSALETRLKRMLDRVGVWRQRLVNRKERQRLNRLIAAARRGGTSRCTEPG